MVKYLKDVNEFNALLADETKLIVIDFTATWCPPCKMIAPIFESMAAEFENAVFVKVDVDAASDIATECEIRAMPTFQFYKGGAKVTEFSGADEAQLRSTVEANI